MTSPTHIFSMIFLMLFKDFHLFSYLLKLLGGCIFPSTNHQGLSCGIKLLLMTMKMAMVPCEGNQFRPKHKRASKNNKIRPRPIGIWAVGGWGR